MCVSVGFIAIEVIFSNILFIIYILYRFIYSISYSYVVIYKLDNVGFKIPLTVLKCVCMFGRFKEAYLFNVELSPTMIYCDIHARQ